MIGNFERLDQALVLLLFLLSPTGAQSPEIKFERLSTAHGLSHSSVYAIAQDRRGFMWFGTENGLNRYDGYQFTAYYNDPNDSTSLSNNWVWAILEDRGDALWIGTVEGLNQFDRYKNSFARYQHDASDPASLSSSYVRVLYEDHAGTLWVGTTNGLNRFERESGKFISYNRNADNPEHLGENYILTICEDRAQTLWVGTRGGLFYFDKAQDALILSEQWRELMKNEAPEVSSLYRDRSGILWIGRWGLGTATMRPGLDHPIVPYHYWLHIPAGNSSFYEDHTGTLWIAANGLFQLTRERTVLTGYKYDPNQPGSLSNNQVRAIYEAPASRGVLWFGTLAGGVSKLVGTQKQFMNYRPDFDEPSSLYFNRISAVIEDNEGTFWIGTPGSGLYKFNLERRQFIHSRIKPAFPLISNTDCIEALCVDRKGVLWVGTSYNGGLHRYDSARDRFTHFEHDPNNPFSLSLNHVSAVHEDQLGVLWIGTDGGGLNRLERATERFFHYQHRPEDSGSLSSNKIKTIFEDSAGVLWIGTWGGGLDKFDRAREKFIRYQHESDEANSLSDNRLMSICESPAGVLWIGTSGSGLERFEVASERFTHFTVKEGLPSNNIYGVINDARGRLWISTDKGLSKFDPAAKIFTNYDAADGLPDNEFSERSYCKSASGELLFGGRNGFTVFHPDSIHDDAIAPRVALTDFKIFNQPAKLDTAITEIKRLTLAHDQNFLSFEFAALSYASPEKNRYRYKMEGVDHDWIDNDTRRFANYTNMTPGEYVFKVKGANHDGVWNETGAAVQIVIRPPWWRTRWAYAAYVLLLGTAFYVLHRLERHRFRTLNELERQRFEAQKLRELDQTKSRFFANVSHEFRTPLTLILGPIEKLLAQTGEEEARQNLTMILRNAQRLLRLINQLLDLSKLEAGRMKLEAKAEEVASILKVLLASFASLAERKKIALEFHAPEQPLFVDLDRDKFEKIITNLLSNAFKFTPEGGSISVTAAVGEEQDAESRAQSIAGMKRPRPSARGAQQFSCVRISVRDTGCGIPADQLEKIFDRFYQLDDSHTREHEGTGIGLALTKELVELHRGKILVESELHQGSAFTVLLPVSSGAKMEDRGLRVEEGESRMADRESMSEDQGSSIEPPASSIKDQAPSHRADKRPVVLIIDDHADMRSFMREQLNGAYHILEAQDGAEGLQRALEKMPDLIVSDVMMPKLDGMELCRRLKTEERTSHIPVVLLTAKATGESKVEGLETGADDYVTKPFEAKELHARVKNLITQRRKLRERFRREMILQPAEVTANSMDEQFLQRALHIVEEHLVDAEFGVETFSQKMAMSRQHLSRKLHALTEHSANDFIRVIRLKRAAQLLEKRSATVTEIAYEVGFNNPAYFAECFRKQFGRSPSQYAAQAAQESPLGI